MNRSYVLIGVVVIAAILVVGGYNLICKDQISGYTGEKINVTLAVSVTPLSAPFYIAEEKGFFEDEGVDVTVVEYIGGHRCLAAVLNGDVDMGTASDLPTMFNSFKRDDYAIITTFVKSDNDVKIITRKDSGITSPEDLRGKKVGATLGSSSQFYLDMFLDMGGINSSEVEVVGIQPEDMPFALQSGDVDAISVWEPFGYETIQLLGDGNVLVPNVNVYTETFNLVALDNYAQSNPEAIIRILRALDRSIAFMNANEDDAQDILVRRLNKDKDFIEWIWPDFVFGLSLDQSLIITLEEEARWAIKNSLTNETAVPNYLNFMYTDGLDEVKPRVISIIR